MEPPTKPNPCGLCQRHGTLLIQLPPRLTVAEAVQLRDDLPSWLSAPELKAVVLDFGHTVVIDSSGIGALVGAIKLAQARSLPLKAWSVNHQVRLALTMTEALAGRAAREQVAAVAR